jgi:hypothetical protein
MRETRKHQAKHKLITAAAKLGVRDLTIQEHREAGRVIYAMYAGGKTLSMASYLGIAELENAARTVAALAAEAERQQ